MGQCRTDIGNDNDSHAKEHAGFARLIGKLSRHFTAQQGCHGRGRNDNAIELCRKSQYFSIEGNGRNDGSDSIKRINCKRSKSASGDATSLGNPNNNNDGSVVFCAVGVCMDLLGFSTIVGFLVAKQG